MYSNRESLATNIYETLDNLMLGEEESAISIDKLLTPSQKHEVIMAITNSLPLSDFEKIIEFNRAFLVPKEETHIVEEWEHSELAFRLLLEEVLEFAHAVGLENGKVYQTFVELYDKTNKKNIETSLVEVVDALTDILYVTYRNFYIMNIENLQHDAMAEVHDSNMSKVVSQFASREILKDIIADLKKKGFNPYTVENHSNDFIIKDYDTGKVMKPLTYKKADLKGVVEYHLRNIKNDNNGNLNTRIFCINFSTYYCFNYGKK